MENIRQTEEKKETELQKEPAATQAITPGQMRVIKRNGSVVPYDQEKIAIAITKAFLAVEGGAAAAGATHTRASPLRSARAGWTALRSSRGETAAARTV